MSITKERHESVSFRDYGAALRQRWPLVALLTLLGLIVGLALAQVTQKTYESHASVQVRTVGASLLNSSVGTANMATEQQVGKSDPVLARAAQGLHTPAELDALKHLTLNVPPASTVLTFTVTASNPAAAQHAAAVVAQAYLDQRRDSISAAVQSTGAVLETRAQALNSNAKELAKTLATLDPQSSSSLSVQEQQRINSQQIIDLRAREASLSSLDITPGSVTEPATVAKAVGRPRFVIAVGTLIGLLLGVLAAFAVQGADRRVRTARDLTSAVDAPVLADLTTRASGLGRRSRGSESLAVLRTRLLLAGATNKMRSILVLGPSDPSIRISTSYTVASLLAKTGARVMLVLTSAGPGTSPRAFGLLDAEGQHEVLQVGDSAQVTGKTWRSEGNGSVTLVDVSPSSGHSAYLTRPEAMRRLLREERSEFDMIVVDGPGLEHEGDVLTCAAAVDAAVLLAVAGSTTSDQLLEVQELLAEVEGRVIGTVLVAKDSRRTGKDSSHTRKGAGTVPAGVAPPAQPGSPTDGHVTTLPAAPVTPRSGR